MLATLWELATYLIVAWCTLAVWRTITHSDVMVSRTLSMQRRLTYMLLTQVTECWNFEK